MKALFKKKFQIPLVLITVLFSCSQQKSGTQEEKIGENSHELVFKPLDIIVGEEYEEELLVATDQATQKMGLYSSEKQEILPVIYDEVYSGLVNPYYVVVLENRLQGLFDVKGNRVCESLYHGFVLSSDPSIMMAYLGIAGQEKWIVINNEGQRIFDEAYTSVEFISKDLVILRNDEYKCSLASVKGNFITAFEFELLEGIRENERNEKWYIDNDIVATAYVELARIFINSKGEIIEK
ncbi:MAG: hypothetical protein ACRBG0_07895 [Lewinella sp.]|uniref:hypothetical protein n=1 Tax=Lewinella sp. TaxID=2004506 RepID=UPI003D6B827A